MIHAGERNRALTIIKSRGTAHSNQVRELVLTNNGITLAEVSTVGGQVLMGTMRWQQEQAEQAEHARLQTEVKRKRLEIEAAKAELQDRVRNLRRELALKETEFELLMQNEAERQQSRSRGRAVLRKMRGGEALHK